MNQTLIELFKEKEKRLEDMIELTETFFPDKRVRNTDDDTIKELFELDNKWEEFIEEMKVIDVRIAPCYSFWERCRGNLPDIFNQEMEERVSRIHALSKTLLAANDEVVTALRQEMEKVAIEFKSIHNGRKSLRGYIPYRESVSMFCDKHL